MTQSLHITELGTRDRPAPLRDPFLEQVDHCTDLFRELRAALPPAQAEAVEAIMTGPFYDGPYKASGAATQPVPPQSPRAEPQSRAPRKPTLVTVAKQANKAAIAVARYEVKPDGTVVVVTGKPEPAAPENAWPLDEFRTKETKQ
jgi:hypothetical protein